MTITISRGRAALGAALVGLAIFAVTASSLVAQTGTPAPGATATNDPMGMMGAATPEASGTPVAADAAAMERCMAMMEMMMGMMGEGMMGMMATPGPGMNDMMDMATPAAGATMMERCMAMMEIMMGMMGDGGMMGSATPGAGMDEMSTPTAGM